MTKRINLEESKMKLQNYMTLKEIEENYKISPPTVRAYISRNEVIPEDKRFKLGNQWLIEREFAEKQWGLKMKNLVYLVISFDGTNEWVENFDSLEKANDDANYTWSQLTKSEKERSHVYVMALTKEDYLKIEKGETEHWYGDFEVEVDGEFNSKEI